MGETITLKELHSDLSGVSANWDSLAIYLRFSTGETAAITANVGGSDGKVEFCFNRVIAAWLSGPREHVTRDVLAAAVRRSNFGNLADEIRDESLKLDLKSVVNKLKICKSEYFNLGIFLNLDIDIIYSFDTFVGDCSRCLLIMLDTYLRDKGPRVEEICEGLVMVSRRDLASSLGDKYKGRQFESS